MSKHKYGTKVWIENRTWKSKYITIFWYVYFSIPFLIFLCLYLKNLKSNPQFIILSSSFEFLLILDFWGKFQRFETLYTDDEVIIIQFCFKKSKIIKISDIESISLEDLKGKNCLILNTKTKKFELELFDLYDNFSYFLRSIGVLVNGFGGIKYHYPLNQILTNVPEKFKKLEDLKNAENDKFEN